MALSDLDKRRALAALQGGELTQFMMPEEGIDPAGTPSYEEPMGGAQGVNAQATGIPDPQLGTEPTPPDLATTPADSSAVQGQGEGAIGNYDFRQFMRAPQAAGPGAKVVGGYNYPQVGGKWNVERATDDPEYLSAEAAMEAAGNQEREGQDLSSYWKQEQQRASDQAAYVKSRRDADQAGEMERQKQLEDQTASYSQSLADRKSFWKNPGNILAAIGFALMPFASDDKAIGIKLLNNAISTDFNQRKQLADGHLGELRSNLAGYRQIASDKQAGDLLAQAEGYRIAAMEVQRIASSYQGPKAQAAAKALTADLMSKYGLTRMEAMNRIYLKPQAMQAPIAKALEGQRGYQSLIQGQSQGQAQTGPSGKGQTVPSVRANQGPQQPRGGPLPGGAIPGPGGPQGSIEGRSGAPSWLPGQQLGPGARVADAREQPVGGPGRDTEFEKRMGAQSTANLEARAPGTAAIAQRLKQEVWQQVARTTGQPPGTPQFNKELERVMGEAEKGVPEVAKLAAPVAGKYAIYSAIQRDVNSVQAAFGGDRQKINDFYGGLKRQLPSTAQAWNSFWNNMGMGAMKPDQRAATERAAQRLNNIINKGIGDYYHEHAGANLAPGEVEMLKKVISSSADWNQVYNFVDSESRKNQAQMTNAALAAPNPLSGRLYLIQRGIDIPKQTSPGR